MTTTKEMQLVPLDKLVPYQNNARTHSPEQIPDKNGNKGWFKRLPRILIR